MRERRAIEARLAYAHLTVLKLDLRRKKWVRVTPYFIGVAAAERGGGRATRIRNRASHDPPARDCMTLRAWARPRDLPPSCSNSSTSRAWALLRKGEQDVLESRVCELEGHVDDVFAERPISKKCLFSSEPVLAFQTELKSRHIFALRGNIRNGHGDAAREALGGLKQRDKAVSRCAAVDD
jgi:hypothetical protein